MTTPYRGRGRGRGGYGRGQKLPQPNVPIIGDWTTYNGRKKHVQQIAAPATKEEIPSTSSGKIISYKTAVENEEPGFFENPNREIILHIENEDIEIAHNNGWIIKTRYLESRGYPGLQNQARPNLEILLTVTESVTITHHFQNNNPESFINFSKCHINKVLSPKEWGLNPNGEKAIKIAEGKYIYYNYWDYIQAFSKAFYYQNPKNKHSWFFSVNPEILERHVPNWFIEWWSKFGPSTEILPKNIQSLYNSWCDNSPLVLNKTSKDLMIGQCPFFFISKFQIPWIWRWAVSIGTDKLCIPVLYRNFFYKWWKGMTEEDVHIIVEKIESTISQDQVSEVKRHESDKDSISSLKDYFQKKYPCESEEEIMVRILDHMKAQFFKNFPNVREDESMKTVSSPGSIDSANTFNCLAGESQNDEPTPEDFWDSLIASVQTKDKGKGAM